MVAGRRRGRPTRPRTGGTRSSNSSSCVTSLRLPPVSVQASGIPPPSTSRWCLLPRRPRSTGLGPVLTPPFSLAGGSSRRPPAPTRVGRRHEARRAAARATAPTPPSAARLASGARLSSRSRSRAPAAGAPSRSRCAARTESPATPAGHPAPCDPDSGSDAASQAATARSAPTTHPAPPTASLASTSLPSLTTDADELCDRRAGPFIQLEVLSPGSISTRYAANSDRRGPRRSVRSRAQVEHLWSRADANARNCQRRARPRKPHYYLRTAAIGCPRLRPSRDGKEGVDGSSPSEGSAKSLQRRILSVGRA